MPAPGTCDEDFCLDGERSLRQFRRAMRYLWPYRRLIITSFFCAMGLALAYSASMGAILPVLKLLIADEGPRTSAMRNIAERRLQLDLGVYRLGRESYRYRPPDDSAIVRGVSARTLLPAGLLQTGDALYLPEEKDDPLHSVLDPLVFGKAGDKLTLQVVSVEDAAPRSVTIELPPMARPLEIAGRIASWLPNDHTVPGRMRTLMITLGVIFCITIVGNVCRYWAEYLVYTACARSLMDIRRDMFKRAMEMPLLEFSRDVSDKMSRVLQDSQEIFRGFNALFGKMMREPLKAIAVFIIALYVDWRLTLIVVLGVPLSAGLLMQLGKRIRRANVKVLHGYGRILNVLSATLHGMRVVRAYGREGWERRRMWGIERQMLRQFLRMGRIDALTPSLIETLGVAISIVAILWLANRTMRGEISPENFLQMGLLIAAIFDPIRRVSTIFTRVQRADAAAGRVFELIDMPREERGGPGQLVLPPLRERIEFRHVTYTYPTKQEPALVDVSFVVPVGRRVAIVGPNGSGKTTIIGLLLRFFEPDSGSVLIDRTEVSRCTLRSVRSQVSLVTQDAVVFAMSAKENIGYGLPHASDEQIIDAARHAHADEFIRRMPQGYETVIGETGATLSGGERQRVALARAILRNAPIFIFDEATSQIDVDSEKKIHEAMVEFMQGRTSIVIAHRIATIRDADHIVVMDRGRVVDQGPHDELIERCGLYRTLYYTHLGGSDASAAAPIPATAPAPVSTT